jgi:apolipoprotein N-acyltransferase
VKFLSLPRSDWRLVIGGALLLGAAYPPFHLFVPSFVCLIPVVWLLVDGSTDARPLRRQLVQGFWFGLFAHGLTLYWMVVALWHFTPLSGLGYLATIVILALYMAGVFGASGWVTRRTGLSFAVTLPVFWTAGEWLIGHQGAIRFPWLGLGTSLTGFPVAVQIADVIGARGVTFLLVLANTALALALLNRRQRRRAFAAVGGVVLGLLLAVAYGTVREHTLELRDVGDITLLQPNVNSIEKWAPEEQDSVVEQTTEMALQVIGESWPDLVVWPEAAVPGYFRERLQWESAITSLSLSLRTPQLVGALDAEWLDDHTYDYFNAAFLIDSVGRLVMPPYRKRYLVPGTERVPFLNPRWFNVRFLGGFSRGTERPVYEISIGAFGVLICFESVFEDLSRYYRAHGADFVVNITNDEWFGRSSAPYQHAAHVVMRAIENRMGIARAANSGISEFVDPLGHVYGRTRLYSRTSVTGRLVTSDTVPLYVRWGDWIGTLSLLMAALLTVLAFRSRR